jgi:hypothetical protein
MARLQLLAGHWHKNNCKQFTNLKYKMGTDTETVHIYNSKTFVHPTLFLPNGALYKKMVNTKQKFIFKR